MKKKRFKTIIILFTISFILFALLFCVYAKIIKINTILASQYEVQGIDVSHYQGEIDWKKIESQNIDFVFIKATEGSGMVDDAFKYNWDNVSKTSILSGAYHFFSFESSPETQAQLYIDTVGDMKGRLPPVIDVEYYGDTQKNLPEKKDLINNLHKLLTVLEDEYKIKPIIYTTYSVYNEYLKDNFYDYPLWIRNIYYKPGIIIGRKWTFWQFSDTEKLDGYSGEEEFIDKNVFDGTIDELRQLTVK